MHILTCCVCHYKRSSEDDGRMFEEDILDHEKLVCKECADRERSLAELMVTGKTGHGGVTYELTWDDPNK